MGAQTFADVITGPVTTDFATITAITETVLIPTAWTPIGAGEPRSGQVWELIVIGTCTTGLAGTLIITPRYGTTIGGTAIGTSGAQNYVASISNAPFIFRCWIGFRGVGQAGANTPVICGYNWSSLGAVGTASSETAVTGGGGAATSVDVSVASALWIGVTFSVAPSVIPRFHTWRRFN